MLSTLEAWNLWLKLYIIVDRTFDKGMFCEPSVLSWTPHCKPYPMGTCFVNHQCCHGHLTVNRTLGHMNHQCCHGHLTVNRTLHMGTCFVNHQCCHGHLTVNRTLHMGTCFVNHQCCHGLTVNRTLDMGTLLSSIKFVMDILLLTVNFGMDM